MFDSLIAELATRFGLGDKARDLLRMLLAAMTDAGRGGLIGFIERFRRAGFGDVAQSWLSASADGTPPLALDAVHVEQVLGGPGGLIGQITHRLGLSAATVTSALAYALPRVMDQLAPAGKATGAVPSAVHAFIGNAARMLEPAGAAPASGGNRLMKWLPWLVIAVACAFLFSHCTKPKPADSTANAAAIPVGAGALSSMVDGQPALKVYFDTGKAEISTEFSDRSQALVAYLKAHADAKAVISGYSDPTGSAAANAQMSRLRAEAVAAALQAAGVPASSVVLEKPTDITGTGDTLAESRRVEVVVRK
ncbi:YidB family protein [Variovorax guangxiensis]|uniref:DUF937 domain-containing protein n=1 Tax=Variovorax guangxiensis TaxID=1775474 RepID=A0A502DWW1_9BURK|nr:YidB family protein [Variovorax guangxiensis]TPG26303.1 DUF937 domain-containing protein [Variovorax ginsengisoli]TPG30028.1 DUF937 domain-containing protein [Variovorax guangxiensis]